MKSQSLSISTIVIIVIAVVVLAAVLLFFFGSLGSSENTVSGNIDSAKCNTILSQIAGKQPQSPSEAEELANSFGYCTYHCDKVVRGVIQTPQGECKLSCNGETAVCS